MNAPALTTTVDAVLQVIGLPPAALWNATDGGPVLVPHGTRDVALPAVLRAIGATRGAEIGVERGAFSEVLCAGVPGLHLTAIDAWTAYPGYREHVTQAKLDAFYAETVARLTPYGATILRGFSALAADAYEPASLDFVYIDANHTLQQVVADLAAWVPKVRPGGIIAGHDYGRASVGHVREAVTAWTSAYRIAPWFVLAGDRSPSFLWVQP